MDKKRGSLLRGALALALALAMCLAVLPADAMADGTERILTDGTGMGTMAVLTNDGDVTGQWASCEWDPESLAKYGAVIEDGTTTLYLSPAEGTVRNVPRRLSLVLKVNIWSSTEGVGNEIRLPLRPAFMRSSRGTVDVAWNSGAEGLAIVKDAVGNYVSVKETAGSGAVGSHRSVDFTYTFDGWYIESDKPAEMSYSVIVDGVESKYGLGTMSVHTDLDGSIGGGSRGAFSNVDGSTAAYLEYYGSVYGDWFGLTEDEFNETDDEGNPKYIYDIMTVKVDPQGQQPYDINGTFVPGSYPSVTNGDMPFTGWDGVLVGMAYSYGDKLIAKLPVSVTSGVAYGDLPGALDGLSGAQAEQAGKTSWNVYEFGYGSAESASAGPNGAIVSSFSDVSGHASSYFLSFLVRYERGSGSIRYDGVEGEESAKTHLYGTCEVVHTGVDDAHGRVPMFLQSLLFDGMEDDTVYRGEIYGAEYDEDRSTTKSDGLTALSQGRSTFLDMQAEWVCRNQCRDSGTYDGPYTLEAIFDVAVLLGGGENGGGTMMGAGDYRIMNYAFDVVDAPVTHGGSDGAGQWDVASVLAGPGADREDVPVSVYYSTSSYGDDWTLLDTAWLGRVWNTGVSATAYKPVPDGALRIKVVFPDSRYHTRIRMAYRLEIMPDGPAVKKVLKAGPSSMSLTQWLDYTAYTEANYGSDPVGVPDLNVGIDQIKGDTASLIVRPYDTEHPQPGYQGGRYPYRKYIPTSLAMSSDWAVMTVGQRVYTGSGSGMSCVGYMDGLAASDVSAVYYALYAIVTQPDGKSDNSGVVTARHMNDPNGSPYKARSQRYYALLPEGFRLADDPFSGTPGQSGFGAAAGIQPGNSNLTKMSSFANAMASYFWSNSIGNGRYGNSNAVNVATQWIGNRQLVVIDRRVSDYDISKMESYLCPYNRYFGYGWPFVVKAVPVDEGGLPAGSYEALFAHQFVESYPWNVASNAETRSPIGSGTVAPVSLSGYSGDNYATMLEAFGSRAAGVDEFVSTPVDGSASLTVVSSSFRNLPGGGSTYAEVKVRAGGSPMSGIQAPEDAVYASSAETELRSDDEASGVYNYALTYGIVRASSKDVVLWNKIEAYDRRNVKSEWRGTLTGVDLNGLPGRVFVSEKDLDLDGYVTFGTSSVPAYQRLVDGEDGWHEVLAADFGTYDWSGAKEIAVWLEGMEFDVDDKTADKPASATVYLNMRAPASLGSATGGQDVYTTYNEIFFSDYHSDTDARATVLTNSADVKLMFAGEADPEGNYEMPNTGGAGTGIYLMSGACLLLASLWLYGRRRRA